VIGMADVINKIKILEQLAKLGGEDEVFILTIDKLTRYKKDKLEADLKDIEIQIKSFEEKYGLDSDEFISDFKRGEAGDNIDFLEWASLHDMKKRINDRLTLLEGA
jgi:hypothetical protein